MRVCVYVCVLRLACGRDISITMHRIHILWGYTDSPWGRRCALLFLLVMSCIFMSGRGLM